VGFVTKDVKNKVYNIRGIIEILYQIFLFLPKGITYGIFSKLNNNEEQIIKISDIKSLFVFIIEYLLIDNPINDVIFLFNSDFYDNPFKIIDCPRIGRFFEDINFNGLYLKNNNKNLNIPPWTGILSIEKESNQNFSISGDALNYSVKCFNKKKFNPNDINIERWEAGIYDYKTLLLILANIADVSNTKCIIYKHNVMEKDFALMMIIEDLINKN